MALRNQGLGTESVRVTNFDLKRDAGTFRLISGTVCFVPPVNGKVTGGVFTGDSIFLLTPPTEAGANKSLTYLTKEEEFNEKDSNELVLSLHRFDVRRKSKKAGSTDDRRLRRRRTLKDSQSTMRHRIKHNLEIEILGEVLSPDPRREYLSRSSMASNYNDKEIYSLDWLKDSDQVDFWTYDENKWGDWASFNFTEPRGKDSVGKNIRIEHHVLDTTFEKSGELSAKSTTTFTSLRNGLRVVPFSLFHTLRVQSVTADGQPLSFIQEEKNEDSDFAVILSKALDAGEKFSVTTTYNKGKMR